MPMIDLSHLEQYRENDRIEARERPGHTAEIMKNR